MMALSFTVLGKPEPGGSKKSYPIYKGGEFTGRIAVSDANPKAKSWQQEIRHAANEERIRAGGIPFVDLLDGPIGLRLRFYRQRPASHYGTGRNKGKLKPSAPAYPATRPDVDKTSRAVLDALSGCIYRDDALIVVKDVRKLYGTPERVEVELWKLPATAASLTPAIYDGKGEAA